MDETPEDYYKRKHEDAEEISDELSRHQLDECHGSLNCETCKRLERDLEQARYVGD